MPNARTARAAIRRGADWEKETADLAVLLGFPDAERRVKHAAAGDRGDHVGFPGLTTEAKARRDSGSIALGIRDLKKSLETTETPWGVVFQKCPNKSTEDGLAVMPLGMFIRLYREYRHLIDGVTT